MDDCILANSWQIDRWLRVTIEVSKSGDHKEDTAGCGRLRTDVFGELVRSGKDTIRQWGSILGNHIESAVRVGAQRNEMKPNRTIRIHASTFHLSDKLQLSHPNSRQKWARCPVKREVGDSLCHSSILAVLPLSGFLPLSQMACLITYLDSLQVLPVSFN